ncbi:MAG: encapsulin [Mycobacterium sp.]
MTGGRDLVGWSTDLWSGLDQAVKNEIQRSAVATTFLPVTGAPASAGTLPADVIDLQVMNIDPSAVVSIVELSIAFSLTQQQVDDEADLGVAGILATRAANFIAQVEDLLIFQGDGVPQPGPLGLVQILGTAGGGLLAAAAQQVPVAPAGPTPGIYGENTFDAVVSGMAMLRAQGQAGPYALALSPAVYADTFVPVPGSLVIPADQIRPLTLAGFVDAPALPADRGLLVSLGGNTVDLVMTVEPTTAFVQVDNQGMSQFRLYERWALRVKDPSSMLQLEFQ